MLKFNPAESAHALPTFDPILSEPPRALAPAGLPPALLQRKIQRRALQRQAQADVIPVAAEAAAGLAPSGGGQPLPASARAPMERSFGADFSSVRVHEGPAPERIGAAAFTQGDDLHFSPGSYQPESPAGRELLGHELAHVVQQRAGRVAGAQGKDAAINADPALEHEADGAGARAARGEAADLPGAAAPSASPHAPVQGFFKLDVNQVANRVQGDHLGGHRFIGQETGSDVNNPQSFTNGQGAVNLVRAAQIPALRVASDGLMAIEDADFANRQAKVFYIDDGLKAQANQELLTAGSTYRLSGAGGTLRVPDVQGAPHNLVRVVAENRNNHQRGTDLKTPVRCNEMAGNVMGENNDLHKHVKMNSTTDMTMDDDIGNHMAGYITGYSNSLEQSRQHNQNANLFTRRSNKTIDKRARQAGEAGANFRYTMQTTNVQVPTVTMRVSQANLGQFDQHKKDHEDRFSFRWYDSETLVGVTYQKFKVLLIGAQPDQDKLLLQGPPYNAFVENVQDGQNLPWDRVTSDIAQKQGQVAQDYGGVNQQERLRAEERLGVNDYAQPDVGGAFMVTSSGPVVAGRIHDVRGGNDVAAAFPYHWGGVVARSGGDTVTLENYARKDEDGTKPDTGNDDGRSYFQMYGPPSHVDPQSQSFHEFWGQFFGNAVTLAFKK